MPKSQFELDLKELMTKHGMQFYVGTAKTDLHQTQMFFSDVEFTTIMTGMIEELHQYAETIRGLIFFQEAHKRFGHLIPSEDEEKKPSDANVH